MRSSILWALALSFAALRAGGVLAADPVPGADPNAATAPEAGAANAEAPSGAQIYVYPAKGQSDRQLDRDRYECHNWAVKQTGFNPSEPHLAPHQQVQVVAMPADHRGTVTGAVTGAVIGASVSRPRDAGEGAVAGAIAGAVIGAAADASRNESVRQTQTSVSAGEQAERARFEKQAYEYRRAISACLEGRGYTVK